MEVGHFALDNPGVGTQTTPRQATSGNITQQASKELRMLIRRRHLEFGNGITKDPQGMDETESIGVKASLAGGFMHQDANQCH
jgi:hypothetical protein